MLRNDSGFTLIEMLVSMAVLGVLLVGMAQLYTGMTRAARRSQSYANIHENVTLAANEIGNRLRSVARNNNLIDTGGFEFVGIDGNDGPFSNQPSTPHQDINSDLGDYPNDLSDRLHFHSLMSNRELDNSYLSERVYYAYWINGENSPKPKSELEARWGIMVRRNPHTSGDTLPESGGQTTPLLDLNESGTNHLRVSPLTINIDFLKFRYYDAETDSWYESWNTVDPSQFPNNSNRLPAAVQIAIRGYDDRANEPGISPEQTVEPVWYQTTVSLSAEGAS